MSAYPPSLIILDCDYSGDVLEPESWDKIENQLKNWNISDDLFNRILVALKNKVEVANEKRKLRSKLDELEDEY